MLIIGSFYAGHFSEAPFLEHSLQGLSAAAGAAVSVFLPVFEAVCEDAAHPAPAALFPLLLLLSVT